MVDLPLKKFSKFYFHLKAFVMIIKRAIATRLPRNSAITLPGLACNKLSVRTKEVMYREEKAKEPKIAKQSFIGTSRD